MNRYAPESRITNIKRTVDHVYLNIVFDHPEYQPIAGSGGINQPSYYSTGEAFVDTKYNVTKTEPILEKCSDYVCSVLRFTIPLDETPINIVEIIPVAGNINITPMIFGINLNPAIPLANLRFPVNCIYVPLNNLTPIVQIGNIQITGEYHFIYSYDQIIRMFNVALETAWVNSGLNLVFPASMPPYFFLDPLTNLINLVVPACFVVLTAPLLVIPRLFMNAMAQNYIDAFNIRYVTFNDSIGIDSYFILSTLNRPENFYYPNGTVIPAPISSIPTTPFYYKFVQQYSTLEYWVSLRKILITTNTIPIRNEYLPAINNSANNVNVNNNDINNSLNIITDFIPEVGNSSGSSRSIAYYTPSAEYRIVDLLSDGPLQAIELRILFQDKNGNIYPLKLSVLQQASIKIAFIHKSLINR